MNLRALEEHIMAQHRVTVRAEKLFRQILDDTSIPSGEDRMQAFLYSGVTLGVEEAQVYMLSSMRQNIAIIKETANRLRSLQFSDPAQSAARDVICEDLQEYLHRRSKELISTVAQQAKQTFGYEERHLIGPPPEELPPAELQLVGFTAYRRWPEAFFAWFDAHDAGALQTMTCTCASCLAQDAAKRRGGSGSGVVVFDAEALMEKAAKRFGSLADVFENYAIFALTQTREALVRILENEPDAHLVVSDEAQSIAASVLSQFMAFPKKGDGEEGKTAGE